MFVGRAPYQTVNETVGYVKRLQGKEAAGFVNATLRRVLDEREKIPMPEDPLLNLSVRYSFPLWLVKRWNARFGLEKTERILSNLSRRPLFCLRVDTSRVARDKVIEELKKEGLNVLPGRYVDTAIYVEKLRPVLNHALFNSGHVSVQDEASQKVVELLKAKRDERILDACCGLGIKGRQIQELFGARLVSMDIKQRNKKIQRFVLGDCALPPFKDEVFDHILLDAPCSSLGIIRKHPEIKWRRKEGHISEFSSYQFSLLSGVVRTLRRGGQIVYSVCSFEEEETEDVVRRAESELGLRLRESFISIPEEYEMDGFFAAILEKL